MNRKHMMSPMAITRCRNIAPGTFASPGERTTPVMNRMIHLITRLLPLLLLPAFSAGAGTVQSNCDVIPQERHEQAGKFIEIFLPGNPTTGHLWIVRSLPPQVALESLQYVPDEGCRAGMTGCGGHSVVRLPGVKRGSGVLQLQYVRPWETLPAATTDIRLVIE